MATHPIYRRCIACKKNAERQEFLRFVKDSKNNVKLDKSLKAPGRGAYVCKNYDCVEKAFATTLLSHMLKTQVSELKLTELKEDALNALTD